MEEVSLPQSPKVIESEENRSVIEINALYPGFGSTIGNALRRVLYSSLSGAAITSVKIKDVPHEFTTIEGVLEDVMEISLNLKQVRLKLHEDEPQTLTLKVKGKKEVKAGDIETPSQAEIVNKDKHLATLTSSKSSLEMELQAEKGLGYVKADIDEKEKKEVGHISLDAIFSPVRKVNFEVENMRVGERTDYNKLLFDITTDGSISPEEAFTKASSVLVEHFKVLSELEGKETKTTKGTSSKSSSSGTGKKSQGSTKKSQGSTKKSQGSTKTTKSTKNSSKK